MKQNRWYILISTLLILAGCGEQGASLSPQSRVGYTQPTVSKEERFLTIMSNIAKSTQSDTHYHKLALRTKTEKMWFKNLMYRLWNREITRSQFIAKGVSKYPKHRYEFTYIANAFQNY